MRIALALLGKELQQHAPAMMGAGLLCGVASLVTWAMALEERWVTLMSAAHGLVGFVLPLLALFVAERLVVHDHQAGTHEFLAALPISPLARAAVRFGMGLSLVLGAGLLVLLSTALLASRREGVPLLFLASLSLQHAGYLFAWFGLAFGIAHTGRYRWLLWWLLLLSESLAEAFLDEPMERLYWFGLMVDGAEQARMAPPWRAMPVTLLWGAAGTLLGLFLSVWRGGWLLERAFRPVTADERARLVGIGVAAMLASTVFEGQAPSSDPWRALPVVDAERAQIRIAASPSSPLWAVGTEAAAALDALGQAAGVQQWPPVVLVRAKAEGGQLPVRDVSEGVGLARVLAVDLEKPGTILVNQVVAEALRHRLAGLSDWSPQARWLLDGLAPWWVAQRLPERSDEARLARLAPLGAGHASVEDWLEAHRALGPDVAVATAWAGVEALEEQAGSEAVLALARAVLSPTRSTAWPSGARLRWTTRGDFVGRWTGVDRQRHEAAWEQQLARLAPQGAAAVDFPPLSIEASGGEVLLRWEGTPPAEASLEWLSLDPLQAAPLPKDKVRRLQPLEGATWVPLRADVRLRVAARWVWADEHGLRTSPWTVSR